ncbi:MAG: amidohydrolase family protein [Clostridiales bacterium]|jgi:predicted TIM-barrel fold metal-dependent hydrolase|nr:amidohydrolase family protein [Clostridiales bacterium]
MIIDTHTHVYPDKIALKASASIGRFYGIDMRFDGSVSMLTENCLKAGVDKCVICSVATTPRQTRSINDFLAETVREAKDISFAAHCALHQDMTEDEIERELNYAESLGMVGIKLHPDFQRFKIDDPCGYKIYERAEGRFPILFHAGDIRHDYSQPFRIEKVLRDFPRLTVIAAHFGGWSDWDEGARALAGKPNLYVDSCSSLYAISPEKALALVRAFGAENVLFGSDYPMWDSADEIEMIERLGLTGRELDLIMSGNASRLFGI